MRGVVTTTSGRRKALGAAIRAGRKAKGWSQDQLARAASTDDETVSAQLVSGYERGQYAPTPERVQVFEAVLGVDLLHHLGLPAIEATPMAQFEERLQRVEAMVERLVSRLDPEDAQAPTQGETGARPGQPT